MSPRCLGLSNLESNNAKRDLHIRVFFILHGHVQDCIPLRTSAFSCLCWMTVLPPTCEPCHTQSLAAPTDRATPRTIRIHPHGRAFSTPTSVGAFTRACTCRRTTAGAPGGTSVHTSTQVANAWDTPPAPRRNSGPAPTFFLRERLAMPLTLCQPEIRRRRT